MRKIYPVIFAGIATVASINCKPSHLEGTASMYLNPVRPEYRWSLDREGPGWKIVYSPNMDTVEVRGWPNNKTFPVEPYAFGGADINGDDIPEYGWVWNKKGGCMSKFFYHDKNKPKIEACNDNEETRKLVEIAADKVKIAIRYERPITEAERWECKGNECGLGEAIKNVWPPGTN